MSIMDLIIPKVHILEISLNPIGYKPHTISKRQFEKMEKPELITPIENFRTDNKAYLAQKVAWIPQKGWFKRDKLVVTWGDIHTKYNPLFVLAFRNVYGEVVQRMRFLEDENLRLRHFNKIDGIKTAGKIIASSESILAGIMGIPPEIPEEKEDEDHADNGQ